MVGNSRLPLHNRPKYHGPNKNRPIDLTQWNAESSHRKQVQRGHVHPVFSQPGAAKTGFSPTGRAPLLTAMKTGSGAPAESSDRKRNEDHDGFLIQINGVQLLRAIIFD